MKEIYNCIKQLSSVVMSGNFYLKPYLYSKTVHEIVYFYDGGAHDFSEGKKEILYSKSRPEILRYNSVQLKYLPLRSWYVSK